mmetsp:Transcript_33634/g.81512  ORF Transcript_33634/g.81512 Transcript_33634/m.81512 type:complete len:291 (-) Transcript_33634:1625-2497(-)
MEVEDRCFHHHRHHPVHPRWSSRLEGYDLFLDHYQQVHHHRACLLVEALSFHRRCFHDDDDEKVPRVVWVVGDHLHRLQHRHWSSKRVEFVLYHVLRLHHLLVRMDHHRQRHLDGNVCCCCSCGRHHRHLDIDYSLRIDHIAGAPHCYSLFVVVVGHVVAVVIVIVVGHDHTHHHHHDIHHYHHRLMIDCHVQKKHQDSTNRRWHDDHYYCFDDNDHCIGDSLLEHQKDLNQEGDCSCCCCCGILVVVVVVGTVVGRKLDHDRSHRIVHRHCHHHHHTMLDHPRSLCSCC